MLVWVLVYGLGPRSSQLFPSESVDIVFSILLINNEKQINPKHAELHHGTFAFFAWDPFLGCVASPFLSMRARGIMSVGFARLMCFRHTGHCDRLGSFRSPRFSPAMRASMRHVWQKRWPVNELAFGND